MGRYVRAVLRRLAGRPDVALTLLVRDSRDAGVDEAIVPGAAVESLRAARRRDAFAVVWFPWNALRFSTAAPAVVTLNDDFAFRFPARGAIARWREQRPIRRAVARAQAFATISHWSRRELIARFALPPERVTVVPLGPDAWFVPGPDVSPYAEPFVLAVGSAEARKNVGLVLRAARDAFPAGGVRVVIVGRLPPRIRDVAAGFPFPVTERIGVDDTELRRLYRTAAVVAVPSLAEGFGLVAAEAQACGAAVVASAAAALPEAIGDAGIAIDPADVPAWAAAFRDLVFDRTRRAALGARATARWAGVSDARTADAVLALLERTVDDRA